MITEIEQAFSGFFDTGACNTAFVDHNLDMCEAAYKLACDAQESRTRLSLPLIESVLLYEALVKDRGPDRPPEEEVTVDDGSALTSQSFYHGRWVLNGTSLSYYSNIMQAGSQIHVFSTRAADERALASGSGSRPSD